MKEYKILVLSGGATYGIMMLGCLERFDLSSIEEYWGTSIGSVICFLLHYMSPFEIFLKLFNHKDHLLEFNPSRENISLFSLSSFINFVRDLTEDITFEQLYLKTHKKLYVTGTNVSKQKLTVFSVNTHPNMKVLEALAISCSIPYIFDRKLYNGEYYVDGALSNNYPIDLADDGERNLLGIYINSLTGYSTLFTNEIAQWTLKLLTIPMLELYNTRIKTISSVCNHIVITPKIRTNILSLCQKEKIQLFCDGYNQGTSKEKTE